MSWRSMNEGTAQGPETLPDVPVAIPVTLLRHPWLQIAPPKALPSVNEDLDIALRLLGREVSLQKLQ